MTLLIALNKRMNLTMKHTPGPWHVLETMGGSIKVVDATCPSDRLEESAIVVGSIPRRKDRAGLANARLIAAAPELLAACELVKRWDDMSEAMTRPGVVEHGEDIMAVCADALKACRAAIAKARLE